MTDEIVASIIGLLLVLGIISGVIASIVNAVRNRRWLAKARASSYDWYKSTYPDRVNGNRVSCCKCDGMRIHVRSLMRRTFLREHVCTQCGTALYYSQEDGVR
jgi:hypothetical protein